jgi:hypothetical protein
MFAIVGLFEGTRGRRERKRMIVNNIKIHCICVGRWRSEMHGKLLNNRLWGKG